MIRIKKISIIRKAVKFLTLFECLKTSSFQTLIFVSKNKKLVNKIIRLEIKNPANNLESIISRVSFQE